MAESKAAPLGGHVEHGPAPTQEDMNATNQSAEQQMHAAVDVALKGATDALAALPSECHDLRLGHKIAGCRSTFNFCIGLLRDLHDQTNV
jgi:hypothetical protein